MTKPLRLFVLIVVLMSLISIALLNTKKSNRADPASKATAQAVIDVGALSINYTADNEFLPDDAAPLLEGVAALMNEDPALKVQLIGYANADQRSNAQARRLSLSRALVIRSFLINKGIDKTRVDHLRALGDNAPGAPRDRVDIVMVQH